MSLAAFVLPPALAGRRSQWRLIDDFIGHRRAPTLLAVTS
jgi:hypothetical protein